MVRGLVSDETPDPTRAIGYARLVEKVIRVQTLIHNKNINKNNIIYHISNLPHVFQPRTSSLSLSTFLVDDVSSIAMKKLYMINFARY